ncbi:MULTISPECIES: hypothetical protein [unclassified Facklamia]|uniref:hypothetical protein n=1 Tax=Aerococcaceae TaxID=186827 RepID=UPI0013BD5138|nr:MULTISPECIES: hypothetical protein [unclassified Facklamia]NEW63734.1 hypothetical protein [Facklamia sp. 252]NEW67205.1 hypothetical protein [Facklamia sp. 253]QQD66256.1 hypothetical protein JDW14_03920 [Aerococcaceae bacterium zg-252]
MMNRQLKRSGKIVEIIKKVSLLVAMLLCVFSNLSMTVSAQEEVSDGGTISGTFSDYIPYKKFNNYQYIGFGTGFENQYTILEYSPDQNGVFQIVMLVNGVAKAYVYQQRSNGLYELACVDSYGDVEDLRYSTQVAGNGESLILPNNLSIGYQYYSGYNNEYVRTIRDILPTYEKNNKSYQEVVMIEETGYADGSHMNYYLAPTYGIICIERVDADGNLVAESSLSEVYNTVYE